MSSQPPQPPRSSLYRRILLSATLTPLLFTSGLLCMAAGYSGWSLLPLIAAVALYLGIPYVPSAVPVVEPVSAEIRRWDSSFRTFCIVVCLSWLDQFPEIKAFTERLTNGSLLTWEPLTFAALFALSRIYRNQRVLRELSNEQIEAYHRGDGPVRFDGVLFTKIRRPDPRQPLPPRPDPY